MHTLDLPVSSRLQLHQQALHIRPTRSPGAVARPTRSPGAVARPTLSPGAVARPTRIETARQQPTPPSQEHVLGMEL